MTWPHVAQVERPRSTAWGPGTRLAAPGGDRGSAHDGEYGRPQHGSYVSAGGARNQSLGWSSARALYARMGSSDVTMSTNFDQIETRGPRRAGGRGRFGGAREVARRLPRTQRARDDRARHAGRPAEGRAQGVRPARQPGQAGARARLRGGVRADHPGRTGQRAGGGRHRRHGAGPAPRARPAAPRHADAARGSTRSSPTWASRSTAAARSRPTSSTSSCSTCRRTTRRATCGTPSTPRRPA